MSGLEYPGVLYSNSPRASSKRQGILRTMLNLFRNSGYLVLKL